MGRHSTKLVLNKYKKIDKGYLHEKYESYNLYWNLCHPDIPDGRTRSKLGKHGKHQLDDLEHSIYDSNHSSYDSMRTLSDLWMPVRP